MPVNSLNPRPGTATEGRPPLSATEATRILSIYRFIMPRTSIRLAESRKQAFSCAPGAPLRSGANAMLIGGLITTSGSGTAADIEMIRSVGLDPDQPC